MQNAECRIQETGGRRQEAKKGLVTGA
jgi:hypothetical protein